VKLRATRLGVIDAGIYLMSETSVERILSATGELSPGTLIVDSIQTVFSSDLPGAPGSVGQVRECAARLTFFGKKAGVSVFLVGHVTKEGAIAGRGCSSTSWTRSSTSRGRRGTRTGS